MRSISYFFRHLIKSYFCFCLRVFYRRIDVSGKENIPRNRPVIFAGNHQLAILDALLIICSCGKQPSTLTSAFIFNSPFLASLLSVLKLMPIYRIRDGAKALAKNEEIFLRCDQLLARNEAVTLFPEANHHPHRRLRLLTKGVARLGFHAMDSRQLPSGVVIVPVGINFSNQYNFNSRVYIRYGQPLEVSEYMDLYRENPHTGMVELKEKVAEGIQPLMIDIRSEAHYHTIEFIREHFRKETAAALGMPLRKAAEAFAVDKKLIRILETAEQLQPETMKRMDQLLSGYLKGLKYKNLRDWVVRKASFPLPGILAEGLAHFLLLPLFLLGLVGNAIPFHFHRIFTRTIVDRQFLPGVRVSISIFFFPLYYLLLLGLGTLFTGSFLLSLAGVIFLPASGYIALHQYIRLKKLGAKWRFRRDFHRNDRRLMRMIRIRAEMKRILLRLLDAYKDVADRPAQTLPVEDSLSLSEE